MSHILTDLKAFLDSSPTSWHAVKEIGSRLALRDFQPLEEEKPWSLKPGGKYFAVRGGALCAFCLPEKPPKRALILASHTDSPALKLKPSPLYQTKNMVQVGVEPYGGSLLHSWLNRDLVIAGRVVVTSSAGQIEERLVCLDDALAVIPQLAIHLDREVNEKGLCLNKQLHLNPILTLCKTPVHLEDLLRRHLSFVKLLSFDLFLVPYEASRFLGLENEMLASYRIDNLVSVHASISALGMLERASAEAIQMGIFYDHEEIGSGSAEGALSPLFEEIFKRICRSFGLKKEEQLLVKHQSLCLSLDMAHALNPNYVEKYEPHHSPLLGQGVAIKYNANQKYATNALSAAVITHTCGQLGIGLQSYVARSDMACGSTVGPLFAERTGIATVDIGCPQLSMHSIREVIATKDYLDLVHLLHHLLSQVGSS